MILLMLSGPLAAGQSAGPPLVPAEPRPLQNIAAPPSSAGVSLADVNLLEPTFLHAGPGLGRLRGEPVAGCRYAVEAYIDGEQAIASARIEAIDERGEAIAVIPMARRSIGSSSQFIGIMTVPAQPFRAALSGTGHDGQTFRRVHRRRFNPATEAPRPEPMTGLSAEDAILIQQMIEQAFPRLIAEVEEDLADNPGGAIALPRMQIANVTYAPLLSAAGRPTGIRVTYQATFSNRSQYNPAISVEADRAPTEWQIAKLNALNSTITPMPREPFRPFAEIVLNELRSSPLEFGAHYTYEGGTMYQFTADLVPNFVVHNLDKSRACIASQQYRHSTAAKKAFLDVITSEAPSSYVLSIGSVFKGRIQAFYGLGTFYQSFIAAGAQDCGPQPTRRF
jgi:hypothetical protein